MDATDAAGMANGYPIDDSDDTAPAGQAVIPSLGKYLHTGPHLGGASPHTIQSNHHTIEGPILPKVALTQLLDTCLVWRVHQPWPPLKNTGIASLDPAYLDFSPFFWQHAPVPIRFCCKNASVSNTTQYASGRPLGIWLLPCVGVYRTCR